MEYGQCAMSARQVFEFKLNELVIVLCTAGQIAFILAP